MEEMVDLELGKVKYKLYLEYFVGQENKEARQQKQEELQSCSLWNENHIHRKTDKMKRHRTRYQMKEQDKTPEK